MSTNKFKFRVGDIVEYKHNLYSSVTFNIGAKFKVTRIASNGNLYLESIDNSSAPFGSYTTDQFELVESKPKFKAGEQVRCVMDGYQNITLNRVYTVIRVHKGRYLVRTDSGSVGGYSEGVFEAVEQYLTPEEVLQYFKEKRQGALECVQPNGLVIDNMTEYTGVKYILECKWRVKYKPEPEIITLNGKRYQALED